jgi:hypothetical protein
MPVKGGIGGANTNANGLPFEHKTSLHAALEMAGFEVVEGKEFALVIRDGKEIGASAPKQKLYKLLTNLEIDHEHRLSKQLWPDEALFVHETQTLFIIEKKYQEVSGSVDEKLQTCDFKRKQYAKLIAGGNLTVEYIYVLNDWFKDPVYADVLSYIESVGCHYFFNRIPLEVLGLND